MVTPVLLPLCPFQASLSSLQSLEALLGLTLRGKLVPEMSLVSAETSGLPIFSGLGTQSSLGRDNENKADDLPSLFSG